MNPQDYRPRDFRWSQRNPLWSWKKLGKSGLTVGGYGCAALSENYIANRAWQMTGIKRLMRPGEYVDRATFDLQGRLFWNSIDRITHGLVTHTGDPKGARFTLMEVKWAQYLHWFPLLDGDLCIDSWDAQIKHRAQPNWTPSGRFRYFRLNA